MFGKKAPATPEKPKLHRRNQHRERYDFERLTAVCPELKPFVTVNIHQSETIDFARPEAVKMLNKALLLHHYGLEYWDIPDGYLCPPAPGRADYIHYMADLLGASNYGKMPAGTRIRCLDIGTGANCIYPIIGRHEYGWSFIGTDIDPVAVANAQEIVDRNPVLKTGVEIRLQPKAQDVFYGALKKGEYIDISFCNPPFHASEAEAQAGTLRKLNNLGPEKTPTPLLNFGGQQNELWYPGGEAGFIRNMIRQSRQFLDQVFWFSTLVSKQSNLKGIYAELARVSAVDVKTIPMGQGNKSSRIVAWTFLDKLQQKNWRERRWK